MIVTHSIVEYIEKNELRKNVRWRMRGGRLFFELFPGFWQHEIFFDKYFPKYDYARFNDKGLNQDKTRIV